MRIKLRWCFTAFIALSLFSSGAYAAGINVHCTGTAGSGYAQSRSGGSLDTSSVIQWVLGNPGAPDPANATLLHSGSLFNTYHVGLGTNDTPGTFDINTSAGQTSFLRVWENGGPAENAYYRTLGPYYVGDPLPSENNVATFRTVYKAAKPMKPQATAGGFSLTYVPGNNPPATGKYLPSFSISAVDQSDPDGVTQYEIVNHNLAIRKMGDAWDPARVFADTESQKIQETDPVNPYYIADGVTQYEVRAQAYNWFGGNGQDEWGESYIFTIPVSQLGGPAATFTFDLYGTKADKLIVNTISVPSENLSRPVDYSGVKKAADLAAVINQYANAAARQNVFPVRAICWWDPVTGNPQRALFDKDTGEWDSASDDLDIVPGVGYMVYLEIKAPLTEDMMRDIVFEGR